MKWNTDMQETGLELFDKMNQPISICVDCLGVNSWGVWFVPNTLEPDANEKPNYCGDNPVSLLEKAIKELDDLNVKYVVKMSDAAKIVFDFEHYRKEK